MIGRPSSINVTLHINFQLVYNYLIHPNSYFAKSQILEELLVVIEQERNNNSIKVLKILTEKKPK
jgi:hypothetical protein